MIKVFIDSGNALATTGTGVYTKGLIEPLYKYSSTKIEIIENNISSNPTSLRPVHRLLYLWHLRKKLLEEKENVKIFHFTNVYAPKKRGNYGLITTIHDIDPIIFPELHTRRFNLYFKNAVRLSVKRSDLILTVTEASRQLLIEYVNVDATRVKVIPNGISLSFISSVDSIKRETNIGIPILLYVGSLSKKKNIAWFIKTTHAGIKKGAIPKLKILLIGNHGFGFNEIENAIKDAGDIVEWKRGISVNELASVYRNSNVVILPSFTEGFGLPLVEAMYCGKPIVASNIPTSREVASEAAQYFELNDVEDYYSAVRTALADTKRAERLSFIKDRIKKFLWQNIVKEYENVYKKVFNKTYNYH